MCICAAVPLVKLTGKQQVDLFVAQLMVGEVDRMRTAGFLKKKKYKIVTQTWFFKSVDAIETQIGDVVVVIGLDPAISNFRVVSIIHYTIEITVKGGLITGRDMPRDLLFFAHFTCHDNYRT